MDGASSAKAPGADVDIFARAAEAEEQEGASGESEADSEESDNETADSEVNRRDVHMLNMPDNSFFTRSRRTTRRKRKKEAPSILDTPARTGRPKDAEVASKADAIRKEFDQWHHHQMRGFNLLLYGYGSKRTAMEEFGKDYCTDAPVVVIKGFLPTVTPKHILHAVSQALFNPHEYTDGASAGTGSRTFRSLVEQRTYIAEALCRGGVDEVTRNSFRAATAAAEPSRPRARWAVGDLVMGQYANGDTYEATIKEVHDSGERYTVDWTDGDVRNRELTRHEVFPRAAELVSRARPKPMDLDDDAPRPSGNAAEGAQPEEQAASATALDAHRPDDAGSSSEDEGEDAAEADVRRSTRISEKTSAASSQQRLYIVVHDIDGPGLAKIPAQETLCFLASLPGVHMMASVNNIHAPLLWNWTQACNLARYNWAWCEASTYAAYELESLHLYSDANSAAGMSGKVRGAAIVLASLPDKTREVFKVLAEHQLDDSNEEKFTGVSFHDYYQESRTKFLTSSEDNFKTLLHELQDHKILVASKLRGFDSYRINFNGEQIEKILRDMVSTDGIGERSDEDEVDDAPAAPVASGSSESVTEECYVMRHSAGDKSLAQPLEQRVQKTLDWCASVTDHTLEDAISKGNVDLFASVGTFIESSGWRRELPAALLLTGLNVADHEHSFLQLKKSLRRQLSVQNREQPKYLRRPSVARVSSANATTLETLMLAIISGLIKDAGEKNAANVSNTLYLRRWYEGLDEARRPTHLIVMIQDVESIRNEIVQDMVRILSSAKNLGPEEEQLPLYVVMGFATSTDALSSVLTHRERSLVVAQRFVLQPARRTVNVLLDSLLDRRKFGGMGAVARADSKTEEPSGTETVATSATVDGHQTADHSTDHGEVGDEADDTSNMRFDMTQELASDKGSARHLEQGAEAARSDPKGEAPAQPGLAAKKPDDDAAALGVVPVPPGPMSIDGSHGCQPVSAGAASDACDLAPSAGSSDRDGQDAAREPSRATSNDDRHARKERLAAFLQDSAACVDPAWPVAVSLPQLSEGAMGQLVDNFFYCNFEIDSLR